MVHYGDLYPQDTNAPTFEVTLWCRREPGVAGRNLLLKDRLKQALMAAGTVNNYRFDERHHNEHTVIFKQYPASVLADGEPVRAVAKIIRDDWQPLEKLWSPEALASYGMSV